MIPIVAIQSHQYVIKTEKFEGPLDLLLSLIEKRKLFINEISLAKIADDYIAHVQQLGSFPIGESAHFILIASTLLLIKSRSLLPNLTLTAEEEASVSDLEDRLRVYKRIRDLSIHVRERFGKEICFQAASRKIEPVFSPHESMTVTNLHEAIVAVLTALPKAEALPQALVKKVISLEQMIQNLTERVKGSLRMSFREFVGGKEDKVNIIVSFLAMLELVKQGMIHVNQSRDFEDITMETNEISVPNYSL